MADSGSNDPAALPQAPIPESMTPIPNGSTTVPPLDVEMADSITQDVIHPDGIPASNSHQSPPQPQATTPAQASVSTPQPQAVQTPTRNSPHPTTQPSAPTHPNPHGSPTRVYLNQNVTPHLLEAMKHLVTQEPDKPLKWLSEFLAQKSLEIEGA